MMKKFRKNSEHIPAVTVRNHDGSLNENINLKISSQCRINIESTF